MKLFLLLSLFCTSLNASLVLDGFAIRYNQGDLHVLDQQKLPHEEEWIDVKTPEQMVEIITSLKVRGAPMIGIAAVLSLSQLAERGASKEAIQTAAELLKRSRPTAVNLSIYLERLLASMEEQSDFRQAVMETAATIYHEDTDLCNQMGIAGANIIEEGEQILTICNTGSLATAGIGTAIGAVSC